MQVDHHHKCKFQMITNLEELTVVKVKPSRITELSQSLQRVLPSSILILIWCQKGAPFFQKSPGTIEFTVRKLFVYK